MKPGTSKRSQRKQRKASKAWLEIGLRLLTEARMIASDRVAKYDAKIAAQEAAIKEAAA